MKNPILKTSNEVASLPNDLMNFTLRDYFAGQVLQGLISMEDSHTYDLATSAKYCYKMADAMLKERSGGTDLIEQQKQAKEQ